MAITCFADEIQESFHADHVQSEWLLADIVRQGRTPTPAEYVFFARCGWAPPLVNDQFRRMLQVLRIQPIAGSPADREATALEAETSAAILEKEGPKLEQKIAELQAKLSGLERDARLSRKRCEEQRDAVSRLRELLPQHVQSKVDQAKVILNNEGVGVDLREAKTRHHELVCILNVGGVYARQEKHIEYALRMNLPEAVNTITEGGMNRYVYSASWPGLKAAAELEFAEVAAKLPELQAAYDAELAVIELALDFYSNGRQND